LPNPMGIGGTVAVYMNIYKKSQLDAVQKFYENGEIFKINNPASVDREYNTLSGSFYGDLYSMIFENQLDIFAIQTMSNNYNAMFVSQANNGFVNIVDNIGQKQLKDTIAFSDTYIQGTKVNGLNKFQPLNRKEVGVQNGEIQKLQLTNKQQEDGKVMLVICDNTIFSAYLGETQLVGSSKNANVAISENVIGTINALKLDTGTKQGSSVIEVNGEVYLYDLLNGYLVQYSSNGLFPISNYKLQRLFKEYAAKFNATSNATKDSLNGFHHITFVYDPYHKEVMAMLPQLIATNTATLLPSYPTTPTYTPNVIDRKDINDNLAKTIVFKNDKNRFISNYEYAVEWGEWMDNNLYLFKAGKMYLQNAVANSFNTFFGEQKPLRIVFTENENPSAVKNICNIAIEGNKAPDFTYVMSDYPYTQITDLIAEDYTAIDGIFYKGFYRDRLSPNVIGDAVAKMMDGDLVKGQTPIVMVEFQQYNELVQVNFINIGYDVSRGHSTILNK